MTDNVNLGAASTWTELPAPPRTTGRAFVLQVLSDGGLVASYSGDVSRVAGSDVFAASSGVFYMADPTVQKTWLDRTGPGMQFWTKDVVIDAHDAQQNTWYAAVFSGWANANNVGGLYRTTNRGQSWTRIYASYRVESITQSPTNPNRAYLTTEADGLWETTDLGSAAPTFVQDPTFPFRHPVRAIFNPTDPTHQEVWIGSFGGGLRVGKDVLPDNIFADRFGG